MNSSSEVNEIQFELDRTNLETVLKSMWGDEESELRQNIFSTFVRAHHERDDE